MPIMPADAQLLPAAHMDNLKAVCLGVHRKASAISGDSGAEITLTS